MKNCITEYFKNAFLELFVKPRRHTRQPFIDKILFDIGRKIPTVLCLKSLVFDCSFIFVLYLFLPIIA